MTDEHKKRQARINRIGGKLEQAIEELITGQKPEPEVLIASIAALASCLVAVTHAGFAPERAVTIITYAINRAIEVRNQNERKT